MAQSSRPRNPFRPGAGARPPVLAGRDAELALARQALDDLEAGVPPSEGTLFFGPRGNGKTVLLASIAEEAAGRGMRVGRVSPATFGTAETLRRALAQRAGLAGTQIRGVQAAGFGVSVEPAAEEGDPDALLTAWIGAAPSPLVILLDEVHAVDPEVGRAFFDAVQQATTRGLPFWLLAAGTPDAPRRIRKAGTFTERMFDQVPVGRLGGEATLRALREPARDAGLPFDDEAAAALADDSQNYPYFIQLLGSAAWRAASAAGEDAVTPSSARRGIAAARPRIEHFYARRYHEARKRGIEQGLVPLATTLRDRGGEINDHDLGPLLRELAASQSVPGGAAPLLEMLTDLGILWDENPGRWEPGIPSFMDYLLALPAPR